MKFVAVEGVDEAGKSTLTKELKLLLESRGYEVVATRMPGGTPYAEELREILLGPEGSEMTLQEQMRLVHKGQLDHVGNKIAHAIKEGKVVLCDRYELSSYVYQVAKQPDLEEEFFAMKAELDSLLEEDKPVYLLLDLPAEEILRRVQKSQKLNHFDVLSLEDIERRRQIYLESIKKLGNKYFLLDATLSPQELALEAAKVLGF